MMEMVKYMWTKLSEEKGEVSVEWVLVAVIMAGIIFAAFLPGVGGAITGAIATITGFITTAS